MKELLIYYTVLHWLLFGATFEFHHHMSSFIFVQGSYLLSHTLDDYMQNSE